MLLRSFSMVFCRFLFLVCVLGGCGTTAPHTGAGGASGDGGDEGAAGIGGGHLPGTGGAAGFGGAAGTGGMREQTDARLVTVGTTGLEYRHLLDELRLGDNLDFITNALAWLSEGRGTPGSYTFLYTDPCDPRAAPDACRVTDDLADLRPFYDAVAQLGELTYGMPTDQDDLGQYSAIVLNFCTGLSQDNLDAVYTFLEHGGGVLVAASNFCGGTSRVNAFLGPLGIAFTELDPMERDYLFIRDEEQQGLLHGVSVFFTFRWAPQVIEPGSPFLPVVTSNDGVLAAAAELDGGSVR